MQKNKTATKEDDRREEKDSTDTLGVRGAGASWQADFGMALNEADLFFSVRRAIARENLRAPSFPNSLTLRSSISQSSANFSAIAC
jgi:hypothetical protein